jgi:exonuclease III
MIGNTTDLRTEPEHAIHFISKTLPDTNIIGFLEYSLYPDTPEKAGVHISAYAGGSIQYKNNNTSHTPLQNGGVAGKAIPVSSKSITEKLKHEMNHLDKYVITNDNFNTKSTDKSFIGKAIYSDGILYEPKQIDIIGSNDSLLHTSYKINKKSIGLYLVNLTDETRASPPLSFKNKITNIIQAIKTNIKSTYNKNVVVIGNFNISPRDDPDAFNQFIDAKYTAIGNPSSFTYIDKTTIDLCYVSEDFKNNFTILNEKDIVVKSGGVSDHYPIYIDIKEKDDDIVTKAADGTITTITPDGSITLKSKDGSMITIKKNTDPAAKPDDLIVSKIAKDGKSIPTTLKATKEKDGSVVVKENNGSGSIITVNTTDASITVLDAATGSSSGSSSGSATDDAKELEEAEKEKSGQLFSTFIVDAKDLSDIIAHNKTIILEKIIQIINIINTNLKHEDYNKITHKLSILSQNVIKLKLIEKELTPDKVVIKAYSKKSKDFAWIDDYAKKETSKLNLIDETKELSKLTKSDPDFAKILPSNIESISNEEILLILGAMTPKGRTIDRTSIQKFLDKLKNDDNAKKIVKHIEDTYVSKLFEKCSYLSLLTENTLSKVISEANTKHDCIKQLSTLSKEHTDKKKDRRYP